MPKTRTFNDREYDLMRWFNKHAQRTANLPEFRRPVLTRALPEDAKAAARIHAEKNPSDPFAGARAKAAVIAGMFSLADFKEGPVSV